MSNGSPENAIEDKRTESRLRIIIFTDKPSENQAAVTSHQSKKALIGLAFLTLARVCVEKSCFSMEKLKTKLICRFHISS